MELKKNCFSDRSIKNSGITIVILAILANSVFVGFVFSPDKHIESMRTHLLILAFQFMLLLLGVCLWGFSRTIVRGLEPIMRLTLWSLYFISFCGLGLFFGGGIVLFFLDGYERSAICIVSLVLTSLFFVSTIIFVRMLIARDKKKFIFSNILFFMVTICTLSLVEILTSFFVPKWPITGLHGMRPESGIQAWGRVLDLEENSFNFNSWGQRDKERTKKKKEGIERIVFIGDSFLEESTIVPFPVVTEEKLADKNVEIINLGVSATSPDEYYYRLKNIASPLQPNKCMMFIYAGNDFINRRTSEFRGHNTYFLDKILLQA